MQPLASVLAFLSLLALCAPDVEAQEASILHIPQAPLVPSREECEQLSARLLTLRSEAHAAHFACFTPLVFQRRLRVITACGYTDNTFDDCAGFATERSCLRAAFNREVPLCCSRIRDIEREANGDESKEGMNADLERLTSAAQLLNKLNPYKLSRRLTRLSSEIAHDVAQGASIRLEEALRGFDRSSIRTNRDYVARLHSYFREQLAGGATMLGYYEEIAAARSHFGNDDLAEEQDELAEQPKGNTDSLGIDRDTANSIVLCGEAFETLTNRDNFSNICEWELCAAQDVWESNQCYYEGPYAGRRTDAGCQNGIAGIVPTAFKQC